MDDPAADSRRGPGFALFCGGGWLCPPDAPGTPAPAPSPGTLGPREALVLTGPYRVLSAQSAEEVPGLLNEIAAEQARGRWVAGYLAYEAGAAFGLTVRPSDGLPLAWMAVYPPAGVRRLSEAEWAELTGTVDVAAVAGLLADVTPRLSVTPDEYARAIGRVRELIAAGDTYQVNYTVRARFDLAIDPFDYFLALVRRQRVPYGAYLDLGPSQMLSLSPEQFLRRRGTSIESMPMKGTRPRGSDPDRDADVARELISSQKDRAENLMIVDMIRNDLGRVSRAGSVRVPALYAVEPYRTVWQMASTVTGRIRREATPADLLAAAFPGASITGAPKHHTMEIIAELETEPRGIYTGAVGLFLPARPPDQASSGRAPAVADDQDRGFVGGLSRSSGGEADPAVDGGGTPGGTGEAAAPVAAAGGDFTCSVAIRTLVHQQGHFRLGVGGGIVWDSRSGDEYQEALDKAAFALLPADGRWEPPTLVERARAAAIGLFETMLLLAQEEGGSPDPGDASHPGPPHPRGGDGRPGSPGPTGDRLPGPLARLPHLAAHLDRLAASAFALDLTFDRTLAETVLEDLAWSTTDAAVVRLDLGRGGQLRLSTRPVPEPHPGPITLLVSPFRTDPYDPLLAHKSTARRLYDRERERAQAIGCHEALFLNQLGLVTEGAVTNLFARFGRHWVTPPVSDGLLPGIWRTAFLAQTAAEERSLTLETLLGADEIMVGNSVRGAMPVGAVWLNELDGLVSSAP